MPGAFPQELGRDAALRLYQGIRAVVLSFASKASSRTDAAGPIISVP